jgi:four helix bundle protein
VALSRPLRGGEAKGGAQSTAGERSLAMDERHDGTPQFGHEGLDAYRVARDALIEGEVIARGLPRGYGTLEDQLRRALLSTVLAVAEGSARSGADRMARFRCARGEASEAAAALEVIMLLGLAPAERVEAVRALLSRVYAMLTRLAKAGVQPRRS